jgi:hypothetical protein
LAVVQQWGVMGVFVVWQRGLGLGLVQHQH